jgi:hypothetical protein
LNFYLFFSNYKYGTNAVSIGLDVYLTQLILGNETFASYVLFCMESFDLKLDECFFIILEGWIELDND